MNDDDQLAIARPAGKWRWRHHRIYVERIGEGNGETGHDPLFSRVVCSCEWSPDAIRRPAQWAEAAQHLRDARAAWRRRILS